MISHCLPLNDPNNQWKYCPSGPAAVLFFILFGISTLIHIFQAIKHRKAFCWVIIMGGLWETSSFALRVVSARNETHKGSYDGSFLLLIISPLLINAFDYMLLGRMVTFCLPENQLFGIRGSMMGVIFVCCDTLSFIIQIGGGLMSLSKTIKTANLGLHVLTGGMIFQQLLIVCFLALTIQFTRHLRFNNLDKSTTHEARKMTHVIRASLMLITYRIIFRIVEFSSSQGSSMNVYINHHEFFTYVFDALPMFFALVLMNIWHPGKFLVDRSKGAFLLQVPTIPNERIMQTWNYA